MANQILDGFSHSDSNYAVSFAVHQKDKDVFMSHLTVLLEQFAHFEWFANPSIADCRFQSRSLLTIDYSTIATWPHTFGKMVRVSAARFEMAGMCCRQAT